jgi:hypothetical protein
MPDSIYDALAARLEHDQSDLADLRRRHAIALLDVELEEEGAEQTSAALRKQIDALELRIADRKVALEAAHGREMAQRRAAAVARRDDAFAAARAALDLHAEQAARLSDLTEQLVKAIRAADVHAAAAFRVAAPHFAGHTLSTIDHPSAGEAVTAQLVLQGVLSLDALPERYSAEVSRVRPIAATMLDQLGRLRSNVTPPTPADTPVAAVTA